MKKQIFTLVLLGLLCSVGSVCAADYVLGASTFNGDKNVATVDDLDFSLSPAHGGTGQTGYGDYIKFSKNKTYTITLPTGFSLTNINIKGYTNSNGKTDGEITEIGGNSQTGKTFPAKDNSNLGTQTQITDGYDFAISQTGGTIVIKTASTNQICVLITITGSVADVTKPTFTLTTPATTTNVATTNRTVVLTASEAITKVGENVAGTLKIGSADASDITYTFDGENNTLSYTFGEDLSYSTTYAFTVNANQVKDAANNQNNATSAYSFTTEADVPAALSSVSPDGGSVNGGSTVTVTAEGTVKYLWSTSSTASKGDDGWAEGASITVPNVSGTRYLHVYAYKKADNQTDITTKTFNITKKDLAVVKSWYFDQDLSDDDALIFNGETSWSPAIAADFTSFGLDITEGLLYKGTKNNSFVIYNHDEGNGSFVLLSTGTPVLRIPSLSANDIVTINTCKNGSSDRSLTFNNATKLSGDVSSSTPNNIILSVTANGNVDLGITGGGMRIYYITVTRNVPIVEVSIGEYEWATFVSDQKLDFTNSDVKAYVVTDHEGSTLTKTQVTTVAANTPLLLNAPEGDYVIPIAASGTSYASNKLVAGDGSAITSEDGKTKYVLGVTGTPEVATFLKIVGTSATVPEGKAYLLFNEEITFAPSAFRLEDEENNATDIQSVEDNVVVVKFIQNGQLYIKRGGITYDALGRIIR